MEPNPFLPEKKTKIICTIGPSVRSKEMIQNLILEGMNIARLNFSHGTFEEHQENIQMINEVSSELKRIIPIFIDLPGVKIRLGELKDEPITLEKNQILTLTTQKNILGDNKVIPVSYEQLPQLLEVGQHIYLNDGIIELEVQDIHSTEIQCMVQVGGEILSNKGINIPDTKITIDPITDYDLEILRFGLSQGINIFSISFIESADDIKKLREEAARLGHEIHIIAKIERARALQNFDTIVAAADGIMIARGDLGVEVPIQTIPQLQKKLIKTTTQHSKPIIVATQMLKSMTTNRRPTRAEVTDVATAISDGADAIMLSEETAIGSYPLDAVRMMVKIAQSVEQQHQQCNLTVTPFQSLSDALPQIHISEIISHSAYEAAKNINARYVLTPTTSGSTARRITRFRLPCWILSFSRNITTCQFLQFSYGIQPVYLENNEQSWHSRILDYLHTNKLIETGDAVVLTQGRLARQQGGTDSLGIIVIGNERID